MPGLLPVGGVACGAETGIIPASNTARNPDILGCGFMGAGMKDGGFGAGWHAGSALWIDRLSVLFILLLNSLVETARLDGLS